MSEPPRRAPREKGFSRDADKLIRRLSLVAFLLCRRGQPATAQQVRERVEGYPLMTDEAFKRRFHEDRAELAELGIEIRRDFDDEAGTEAYSLHPSSYHLPPIDLTDDEISALAACLFVLQDRFAFSQPLRLALLSLAHGRPELLAEAGAPPLAVVAGGGAPASSLLPKLEAAVAERKTVVFDYYAIERDETLTRTVDPYSLLLVGDEWYLLGWCHLREAVRTFRLSRVRSRVRHATRAPHDFAPPSRFELADYLDRAPWQLGGVHGEASVRIDGDMAWWVEAHFAGNGSLERLSDGAVRFATAYSSGPQLVNWVLGLGEAAELEAPAELRSLLVAQLHLLRRRLDAPPAVDEARLEAALRLASGAAPGEGGGAAKTGASGPGHKDRVRAAGEGGDWHVEADRFTRLSTLLTYLLRSCREGEEGDLDPARVAADLEVTVDDLKADVRLLNLVNFGGDGAIVYAEFERGRLRVTCDLAGPAFANPARLSPLQADVLLLAVELVGGQLPVKHGAALRAAAAKLAAARSATSPALGAADALPLEEGVLDAVNDAIRRRRLLEIEYWSEGTGRSTRRVVEPYLLVRSRGEWYYVSYCRTSAGRRTFRVATTKSVRVLEEGFTPRADMELDLYRREGIPGSERYASRTAAVWYARTVRRWIEERQPVEALPDGSCVAAQPYVGEHWLVAHLLPFGGEAVPLAPPAATAALRAAVAALLARYERSRGRGMRDRPWE